MTRPKAPAERARQKQPVTRRRAETGGSVGVLVVHGIGNRKPGKHFDKTVNAIIPNLDNGFKSFEAGTDLQLTLKEEQGVNAQTRVVRYKTGRVLCVDGYWATGVVDRPARMRAALWLLAVLPAVLLLFGPDSRDRVALDDDNQVDVPSGVLFSAFARLAFRLFAALMLTFFVVQLPVILGLPAFVLVVTIVAIIVIRSTLLTDLYLACATEKELDAICLDLAKRIDFLTRRCRHVTVLGHSQGGYLSYLALLKAESRGKCALFGIASGLKPIWILRVLRNGRFLLVAWAAFLVEVALFAWFVIGFNDDLSSYGLQTAESTIGEIVLALYLPVAAHDFAAENTRRWQQLQELADAMSTGWLKAITADLLVVGALGLMLWFSLPRIKRLFARYPVAVPNIQGLRRWIEISSHHDLVGRMLFPRLPKAAEMLSWPVSSNLLTDHLLINRSNSALARYAALVVKGDRASKVSELDISNESRILGERLGRWRSLANYVQCGALAGVIFWQSYVGGTPRDVLTKGSLIIFPVMVASSFGLVYVSLKLSERSEKAMRSGAHESPIYAPGWSRWLIGCVCLVSAFSGTALVIGNYNPFFAYVPLVYGVLILAGFVPSIWFMALTLLGTLAYAWTLRAWPHPAQLPAVLATPALPAAVLSVSVMVICIGWLARQRRLKKTLELPLAVR